MTYKFLQLNLGCGSDKRPDCINIDINPKLNPDMLMDFENPLPLPSNTFEIIYASQIMEHLKNYVQFMQEIHRILKVGGILELSVPSFISKASVIDPSHIRFFIPESFQCWGNPNYCNVANFSGSGLFDIETVDVIRHKYLFDTDESAGQFFTELKARMVKVLPGYWLEDKNKAKTPQIREGIYTR